MKQSYLKALTIGLLCTSIGVSASKVDAKVVSSASSKSSALSEANMLAVAESMAKAKLHAKASTKAEDMKMMMMPPQQQ